MTLALSISNTIKLLRARYPDGLVCNTCGRLLATTPASYAKSNLAEAERLAYVCYECRQEGAEAERVAQVRRNNLALARAARTANVRKTSASDTSPTPDESLPASPRQTGQFGQVALTVHRGGRPRKHHSALARKVAAREYVRAHRERRRLAATSPTL